MGILEIILTAVGLAMDAFAVAVCKGLASKKVTIKNALKIGIYFGLFQALMPLIGYFFGSVVASYVESFDHWVVFGLLAFVGGKMIYEALSGDECVDDSLTFKVMIVLAIATSIDALAVGLSFSMIEINIFVAVGVIGVVTLLLSGIGYWLGNIFGSKYKNVAEIFGGVILVLMGLKILLEHLQIINF